MPAIPADPVAEREIALDRAAFPIVGIGASAGGLEAFSKLLEALPPDTGMAFVLVQHLSPTHESALAEILSRTTRMAVLEAGDESAVQPNHVYVIPPDRDMVISAGTLQLLPREGGGSAHRPVDHFFRSLAEDQRHRSIGVVLSGTASDGTLGLEAIKAEGGITFAQDDSAQHGGMPQSAIASGCVDFVLPPGLIARELARVAHHPYALPQSNTSEHDNQRKLARVLELLHRATGVDFSQYKFNTLYRRVTRRMVLQKLDDLDAYADLLRTNPEELQALYGDILINVTSFFRNPEAFEALKEKVFARLLDNRGRHDPVRIWTLGCSTGQEAYSLAMAFTEFAEARGSEVRPQVFATDLSEAGIETARAGIYPKDIAQDVNPERLRRFFVEVDGHYRIARSIRDVCVFSRHNVLADPPFSRLDLVSCRNLLIYLEPVLQQKVMPTLHYALKPSGHLWLGTSETIGGFRNLFEPLDVKQKIYARKPGPHGAHFPLQHGGARRAPFVPLAALADKPAQELHREADRLLLTRFAPPSVLVSADLDILQYRGDTSPYLAPAPGKASLSLLKMLREGLLVAVRAAVRRAGDTRQPTREEGLRIKSRDGWREVSVEVVPLRGGDGKEGEPKEGGFLVLFDEPGHPPATQQEVPSDAGTAAPVPFVEEPGTAQLARELAATREYLQSVIDQQEAANEELQSSNEEIQSANEELQSANEELETSKEEIQSSNEELVTVNDELNSRNAELNRLNNDLVNVFASVRIPIVLVGPDLCIRRFTPTAEKLLNLVPGDIGRPLAHIKLELEELPDLEPLLADVLGSVVNRELEVRDRHGNRHMLRLRPYRTLDNRIDGVVVILVDIEQIKRASDFTESIVATVREPLLVLDADQRVQRANPSFYEHFHVTREQTEGRPLYELGNGQWNIAGLRQLLRQVLPRDNQFADYEVRHQFEHIGQRTMLLNARRLLQPGHLGPEMVLLAIEDITERQRAEEEARRAAELAEADRRKNEFLAMLAHELRNPLAPIRSALQILQRKGGDHSAAREVIERQIEHMVRLVDDLLDVSRITRGRIELRRTPVELAAVVQDAVEAARPACASKGIAITTALPPEPLVLNADPIRLVQVLGNLLTNGCKFTDKGGGIELRAERDGPDVVIRVHDSGIGIAADDLPRIFDMFVQVDTSLERTGSGLGIGLTLVKKLVELHGGTVQAFSAGNGQGTDFVVRLPIGSALPAPAPAPRPAERRVAAPRRILVVDDNRDAAKLLAQLLEMNGYQTQTAHDGIAAVEAAAQFRPDVALLDIGLPKLNGYAAAQRIREAAWGRNMVLVALTGWGQDEDRRKSREAGFTEHLVKPVDYDALLRLLEELPGA